MRYLKHIPLFTLIILSNITTVNAAALSCGGATSLGGDYTIPLPNITAPATNDGYTLLYTAQMTPGRPLVTPSCNGQFNFFYTITTTLPGMARNNGGNMIHPTSTPGIGLSFEGWWVTSGQVPVWPEMLYAAYGGTERNLDMHVIVKVWKTPEFTLPLTGPVNISEFSLLELIQPVYASDTFATCPPGSLRMGSDNRTCVVLTRELKVTGIIQPGTCDMVNPAQVVQMGAADADVVTKGKSPWVDARFQLTCPQAWGYGASVVNSETRNDTSGGTFRANGSNQTIKIKINPRTQVVNAAQGMIALSPGGARGVGIQLAWGLPGTQTSTPSRPVPLGTTVVANSLNSNFRNGPYALGSYGLPVGADGTINMSARYIRLPGELEAGPANASVEVQASYE